MERDEDTLFPNPETTPVGEGDLYSSAEKMRRGMSKLALKGTGMYHPAHEEVLRATLNPDQIRIEFGDETDRPA